MLQQSREAKLISYWASLARPPITYQEAAHEQSEIILFWADLGRRVAGIGPQVSWEQCDLLTKAALAYAKDIAANASDLLMKSNSWLSPLEDPLTVDMGLNRWLARDREEAYSDWLAWILSSLGDADLIGRLLYGNEIPQALLACKTQCVCDREVWAPRGHVDQAGRLDLVLRFDAEAVLVIEVKVEGADSADTVKQSGYYGWLVSQEAQFKDAVLLAIDGKAQEYNGFNLVCWRSFCQRLRLLLPEIVTKKGLVTAALSAGFIAAAERNILQFPSLCNISQPSVAMLQLDQLDRVIEYLTEFANSRRPYGSKR